METGTQRSWWLAQDTQTASNRAGKQIHGMKSELTHLTSEFSSTKTETFEELHDVRKNTLLWWVAEFGYSNSDPVRWTSVFYCISCGCSQFEEGIYKWDEGRQISPRPSHHFANSIRVTWRDTKTKTRQWKQPRKRQARYWKSDREFFSSTSACFSLPSRQRGLLRASSELLV